MAATFLIPVAGTEKEGTVLGTDQVFLQAYVLVIYSCITNCYERAQI